MFCYQVKDGTSCSQDSFNKCVNGICRPAGCNNQLDSDATLDKCGVCNGNNDTCMDIVGSFRPEQIETAKASSKTPFYYHVTVIPKGASNIEILQPGYSDDLNYIGKNYLFCSIHSWIHIFFSPMYEICLTIYFWS